MKIIKFIFVMLGLFSLTNCVKDFNEQSFENEKVKFRGSEHYLLEVSYEITTFRDFEIDKNNLSELDLAAVNPSSEKQRINMKLFNNGQMKIEIENLDFNERIVIPHKTLPDNSTKIHKTVIQGSVANFYDKNGVLLNTENISIPNNIELVNKIKELKKIATDKEINELLLTMNGIKFISNLNDFINNAQGNNIVITDQGNGLITARFPISNVAPGMSEQTVLLIDTKRNKLLGTKIYDQYNELLQSTLFAYNKGKVQSLKAIQIKQLFFLPSGNKTHMITLSKIENLKYNLKI